MTTRLGETPRWLMLAGTTTTRWTHGAMIVVGRVKGGTWAASGCGVTYLGSSAAAVYETARARAVRKYVAATVAAPLTMKAAA